MWERTGLEVTTDLRHGGRWTSLRTPDREWLWRRGAPGVGVLRDAVRPGDAFVDEGGVEECFPTLRGHPDHGDAWSRPWASRGGRDREEAWVDIPGLRLRRRLAHGRTGAHVDYRVEGAPNSLFVHAVHALLAVGVGARLLLPAGLRVQLLDTPRPGCVTEATWPPMVAGRTIDELGPIDGSATAALVPGCRSAVVVDGASALELSWSVTDPASTPVSLLLWRNLGGWPEDGPYRSIGVEPVVGRTVTLRESPGGPPSADAAVVGSAGYLSWRLRLRAWRRAAPG